jgi:hypothetical protein
MNVVCPVHGFRRLGMLLIIGYAGQVIPQEAKLDELLNTYNPARKTARMRTRPKGRIIKPYLQLSIKEHLRDRLPSSRSAPRPQQNHRGNCASRLSADLDDSE